jgi:ribosomal-protein-alanine acetyltransferase
MGQADLPAIAAIQAASPEASQWKPEDYLQYDALLVEPGIAFIVTRQVAPGEREILNLAVAPEARRTGVGRALLKHVLDGAPGSWFLEVRESNQAAIRLYESTGFRASGKRPGYYSGSSELAIVMHFQS